MYINLKSRNGYRHAFVYHCLSVPQIHHFTMVSYSAFVCYNVTGCFIRFCVLLVKLYSYIQLYLWYSGCVDAITVTCCIKQVKCNHKLKIICQFIVVRMTKLCLLLSINRSVVFLSVYSLSLSHFLI